MIDYQVRLNELSLLEKKYTELRDKNKDNHEEYHKWWTKLSTVEAEMRVINGILSKEQDKCENSHSLQ